MMRSLRFTVLFSTFVGCGTETTMTPMCDNMADGDCPAMCSSDPDCEMTGDNGVEYDDIFEAECLASVRCGLGSFETACVCVPGPTRPPDDEPGFYDINRVSCSQLSAAAGTMRDPDRDFCVEGAAGEAALTCNMPGMYREAGQSEPVTVYGVVDVFGNGGDADGIEVTIYAEGADGALGEQLGSATAITDDPCVETEDEIDNDMIVGTRQLGFFAIPNIPSDIPLVVHTSGNADFWRDIYAYNVQAAGDELETGDIATGNETCDGTLNADSRFMGQTRWRYRARILSSSDWTSIPLTAGLVEGVRATSGAIAGEAHDCDDVRLEFAQVATNPPAQVLTYFTDNPDNPLPAPGRMEGTSLLGLYAALDIPAGPVDVSALGSLNGDVISLGWYRAQVFSGAITTVTLRGLRPHQVSDLSQ